MLEAAHERRRCRDRETNEVITEVALDDLWVIHGSFAGEINNAPRRPWMKLDCIWKTADLNVARMTLGGRRRPPPRRRREGQGGTSTGCRRAPLGPRSRSVLASPAPAKNTTEERKKDATDAQDVGGQRRGTSVGHRSAPPRRTIPPSLVSLLATPAPPPLSIPYGQHGVRDWIQLRGGCPSAREERQHWTVGAPREHSVSVPAQPIDATTGPSPRARPRWPTPQSCPPLGQPALSHVSHAFRRGCQQELSVLT